MPWKKGLCSQRARQGKHRGSLSYLGRRSELAVTRSSPLQGPGSLPLYQYSNQNAKSLELPHVLKTLNHVAMNTAAAAASLYPAYKLSFLLTRTFLFVADMVILTMDFINCLHVDSCDNLPGMSGRMISELNFVLTYEPRVSQSIRSLANYARQFVQDTDCAVPTTCSYQMVPTDKNKTVEDLTVNSHYYFVNAGFNGAFKIYDKMTMTFCGSLFQHCTSVPLFTQAVGDNMIEVHVGSHPEVTWLAWGSGKTKSKTANSRKRKR